MSLSVYTHSLLINSSVLPPLFILSMSGGEPADPMSQAGAGLRHPVLPGNVPIGDGRGKAGPYRDPRL